MRPSFRTLPALGLVLATLLILHFSGSRHIVVPIAVAQPAPTKLPIISTPIHRLPSLKVADWMTPPVELKVQVSKPNLPITPIRRLPPMPSLTAADWMTPPVELKGQVTLQTTFGKELNRLAQLQSVHLVLEIGTWFGGGSSWCIAQGLRSSIRDATTPDKWLITLEMFEPAWQYASKTLQRLPVTCMKGGTVGLDGYLRPEQMSEQDRESEHYKLYYARDVGLARETTPLLGTLCTMYDFDLVLIDGNEYTGLAEFEIVETVCRPRYLALHDTGTLKTRRVELMLQSSKWTKISSGMDAAGWAVYESEN
jgi:hypothetical protein